MLNNEKQNKNIKMQNINYKLSKKVNLGFFFSKG